MTPELWKEVYNWSLVPLIGGGVSMIAVMLYRKQYKWGFFFTGVFASVLIYEAHGALENGKTISSQFGMWIESEPVWAYSALALMILWMVSLAIHLFAAGNRPKKK